MRVVIIGSGLMGLLTAFYLRQAGADVCVIDRQDSAGRETSFANGGMLHASQVNPWNAPGILWAAMRMIGSEESPLLVRKHAIPRLARWGIAFVRQSNPARYAANIARNARLAQYSIAAMHELRASLSLDYDFAARGTLTIYRTQQELDAAGEFGEQISAGGIESRLLDRDGAVALEPALKPVAGSIVGASHYPDDESGDAFKFCQQIQRQCDDDGVEFCFRTRVNRLIRDKDAIVAADTDGRRFHADKFVIAAGSFSPLLSRSIGLRLPVQPVKGYSITTQVGGWEDGPQIPVIDEHLHAAVCPLGNRLRVAGTAEFTGYNTTLTKSRIDNLFRLLLSIYPAYEPHLDRASTDRWTGLRPMSPDGVGIMGRTRIRNLYVNTGHGHLGWTMAAGAGKAVAAEVTGDTREFDLNAYRLENR